MCSLAVDWLSETVPEFGQLQEADKAAIVDFALLWSFFEGRYLGNQAGMAQLREYVSRLPDETLNRLELGDLAAYFRDRYVEGENFSYRYDHLHLDRSGNPEEVTRMLRNQANSERDTLIGCLGIIYRYRNNLFHGEKMEISAERTI